VLGDTLRAAITTSERRHREASIKIAGKRPDSLIGIPVIINEDTSDSDLIRAMGTMRSGSSDATSQSCIIPQRISNPLCHNSDPCCATQAGHVGEGGAITAQRVGTPTMFQYSNPSSLNEPLAGRRESPGRVRESPVGARELLRGGRDSPGGGQSGSLSTGISSGQRKGIYARRTAVLSLLDDPSCPGTTPMSVPSSPEGYAASRSTSPPTGLNRSRPGSLRKRRVLKLISERSMSSDTMYVSDAINRI